VELENLTVNDKQVAVEVPVEGGYTIRLMARNISQTRTGLHAKVYLGVGGTLSAYSYFNVERDEDRGRLANSAHRKYPEPLAALYSREQLKHDLDVFSMLIWPKWVEAQVPGYVVGMEERTLPSFMLSPYIVQGGGTIIFGPPERMKTMTAMTMAIAIDAGVPYPFQVTQAPVLYVNLERPADSMQRRLGDLNRALGLGPDRPLLMLNARGKSLADVEDGIAKAVEQEGVQVGFLDSISRAGYGDLIDNRVANQTIDILNGLFPSWVGIAHSPRNDATHMYGSMHFEAGADVIVQLLTEYQDNRIGVGLQVVKANDMKRPPLGSLGYEFDEYGVRRIWRPTTADFPELLAVKSASGGLTEEVRLFLLGNGEAWADDIAKAISHSRGSVAKILAASPVFQVVRKEGHKVFYGVAERPETQAPTIVEEARWTTL
jgi:hypothetical protein